MGRASYQKLPNIRLGHSKENQRLTGAQWIGVFKPDQLQSPFMRIPLTSGSCRNIAVTVPELAPVDVAVRLATGGRVTGLFDNKPATFAIVK